MTTPSEETILAAARNCGFATFGGAFTALDTELIALYRAAYAAGMERAAGIAACSDLTQATSSVPDFARHYIIGRNAAAARILHVLKYGADFIKSDAGKR